MLQPPSQSSKKRASIRDVAREAGVSHTTVSQILNGKAAGSSETRAKVFEAAERLEYEPDALYRKAVLERARGGGGTGKKVETKMIAFLIPDWMQGEISGVDGYFSRLLEGVMDAAAVHGYHIILCPLDGQMMSLPAIIQDGGVDAVLFEGTFPQEMLNTLVKRYPCACMDRYYAGLNVISVSTHWPTSAEVQIAYAWKCGHRNFAFYERRGGGQTYVSTYRAFYGALEDIGAKLLHPELSRPRTMEPGMVESFIDEWLACDPRPTVIFTTDFSAWQLVECLNQRGIRVPDDVSIIARTGHHSGLLTNPPLTTYQYPVREIGRRAATLLIESIRDGLRHPVHVLIEGQLIERSSVAILPEKR